MNRRFYKPTLLLVAALAFTVNFFNQRSLNSKRAELGLTRVTPLENAPPVLAFSTVALGGFRGLIVNFLFVRSNQLQLEGRFFETMTLGDWITKLQPTFTPVWRFQAWNMAFNISKTFEDPNDRFRWVWAGIKLLRDEGLRYNPTDAGMYRELGQIFYTKIGRFTETTHFQYKRIFVAWMDDVFPDGRPDYEKLGNPQNDEERRMKDLLENMFNMDLEYVRKTDEEFGPLDWRLPETHAIYWCVMGLDKSQSGDPMVLYRVIWQSMKLAFERGTLNINPHDGRPEFSPNIDIVEKVNLTYEKIKHLLPEKADYVARGQEFFLHDAIYFLFLHGREEEANTWYQYLKSAKFKADYTWVRDMPLQEFVMLRIQQQVNSTTPYKTKGVIEAYIQNFYYELAMGNNKKAEKNALFAKKLHDLYHKRFSNTTLKVQRLSEFKKIQMAVLINCLSGYGRFSKQMGERLRITLGLPKDWNKDLKGEVLDSIAEKAALGQEVRAKSDGKIETTTDGVESGALRRGTNSVPTSVEKTAQ